MASSDFDFADSDGSGIKIVATLTSFKPSDEYAKDCDLQFATLRPPTNNDPEQTSIPLPTSLEAVFIGTRGGKVSESITFEAIEWLTMGSSSIFPAFEKEVTIVIGLDTEAGRKGGVATIQLCAFAGTDKPGRIIVAHKRSGVFASIGLFLSGKRGKSIIPVCAGAEFTGGCN